MNGKFDRRWKQKCDDARRAAGTAREGDLIAAGLLPQENSAMRPPVPAVTSDVWVRNVSFRLVEFEDNTVDVYIYVNGLLHKHLEGLTKARASLEIGATIFEFEE